MSGQPNRVNLIPFSRPDFRRRGAKIAVMWNFLGHPWIFEHLRPLAVGGIDFSHAYKRLQCGDDAIVLDVGCGTGDALRFLPRFRAYLGADIDRRAIDYAARRWRGRENARFECRRVEESDVRDMRPTHAALIGLLHHMPDDEASGLLRMLAASPDLRRVVALDTVFLPARPATLYNNLMARMDRGRFVRGKDAYAKMAVAAGFRVEEQYIARSHPARGLVWYNTMILRPAH